MPTSAYFRIQISMDLNLDLAESSGSGDVVR
jgi:hypothetical protein